MAKIAPLPAALTDAVHRQREHKAKRRKALFSDKNACLSLRCCRDLTDALHRQLGKELLAQPAKALPAQHAPKMHDECANSVQTT